MIFGPPPAPLARARAGRCARKWVGLAALVSASFLPVEGRAQTDQVEVSGPSPEVAPEGASSASAPTEEVESFVLDYRAPDACPGRASFEELTRGLTAAARFQQVGQPSPAQMDSAPRRMTITISQRSRDFFGTLELVDEETRARRQFDAQTCEEIVEALALATALAIDPNALGGEPEPAPEPPPEEEVPEEAPRQEPKPSSDDPRLHLELGVFGGATWLLANQRTVSLETGVEEASLAVLDAAPRLELFVRSGTIWSSLNASLGYGWASPVDVSLGVVPHARFGVCPIWWSPVGALRLGACAGASGGRMVARPDGEIAEASGAVSRTWGQVDGMVRMNLLLGPMRLGVGGGVVAPLTEIPYYLASSSGSDEELLTLRRRAAPRVQVSVMWELF